MSKSFVCRRSPAGIRVMTDAVEHARLQKYDFLGLLSVLLYHTSLASLPLDPVVKLKSSVIVVR